MQERFVDSPDSAVSDADTLVTQVMVARGYPTEGYEQRLADLSVEHARTLDHYRSATEVNRRRSSGEASTEDLRQAMVHYRALFDDLLGNVRKSESTADADTSAGSARTAQTTPPRSARTTPRTADRAADADRSARNGRQGARTAQHRDA